MGDDDSDDSAFVDGDCRSDIQRLTDTTFVDGDCRSGTQHLDGMAFADVPNQCKFLDFLVIGCMIVLF